MFLGFYGRKITTQDFRASHTPFSVSHLFCKLQQNSQITTGILNSIWFVWNCAKYKKN